MSSPVDKDKTESDELISPETKSLLKQFFVADLGDVGEYDWVNFTSKDLADLFRDIESPIVLRLIQEAVRTVSNEIESSITVSHALSDAIKTFVRGQALFYKDQGLSRPDVLEIFRRLEEDGLLPESCVDEDGGTYRFNLTTIDDYLSDIFEPDDSTPREQ